MIRALVVDDSASMRRLVRSILERDPEIAVVGEAADGEEAVAMAAAFWPDIITMDIRMPRLDGLGAIRAIMRERPAPIVVLCADSRDRTLGVGFEALKAGAVDVIEKPHLASDRDLEEFAAHLLSTVHLMAEVKVVRQLLDDSGEFHPVVEPAARARAHLDAVGICSSTGGPAALEHLLRHLPESFPAPIAVVQHISDGFLHGLVEWLRASSPLEIRIAEDGEAPRAGAVYFAPEHTHLRFGSGGVLRFADAPPVRSHRPSGEVLFASMAERFGNRSMGVVLTGMGEDGADGLAEIARRRGIALAQDEATSVVYGMPRAAVERAAVTEVLPLDRIAERMVYWAYGGRVEVLEAK